MPVPMAPMPGKPPMTPMPAAAPSPNMGAGANGMQVAKQALMMLEHALPSIPLESELHEAVRKCINALSDKLPKANDSTQQGLQQSTLRDMALRQQQQAPMIARLMAQRGGQPQTPAAPPPA